MTSKKNLVERRETVRTTIQTIRNGTYQSSTLVSEKHTRERFDEGHHSNILLQILRSKMCRSVAIVALHMVFMSANCS